MLERLGGLASLLEELREAVFVAGILQSPVFARGVEGEKLLVFGDRLVQIAFRSVCPRNDVLIERCIDRIETGACPRGRIDLEMFLEVLDRVVRGASRGGTRSEDSSSACPCSRGRR